MEFLRYKIRTDPSSNNMTSWKVVFGKHAERQFENAQTELQEHSHTSWGWYSAKVSRLLRDVNHAGSGPTHAYPCPWNTRASISSSCLDASLQSRFISITQNLWNALLRPFPPRHSPQASRNCKLGLEVQVRGMYTG